MIEEDLDALQASLMATDSNLFQPEEVSTSPEQIGSQNSVDKLSIMSPTNRLELFRQKLHEGSFNEQSRCFLVRSRTYASNIGRGAGHKPAVVIELKVTKRHEYERCELIS